MSVDWKIKHFFSKFVKDYYMEKIVHRRVGIVSMEVNAAWQVSVVKDVNIIGVDPCVTVCFTFTSYICLFVFIW